MKNTAMNNVIAFPVKEQEKKGFKLPGSDKTWRFKKGALTNLALGALAVGAICLAASTGDNTPLHVTYSNGHQWLVDRP